MSIELNNIDIKKLTELASAAEPSNKKLLNLLKKRKPKELDNIVHDLHQDAFDNYDCLDCGNCCRSLGPRITDKDIEKLSKNLKLKPSDTVEKYFRIDEDNDFVFRSMPCPFLADDNYCFVYEDRPKACREYPHTDRKRFYQLLDLSLKNTYTCPIVYWIFEKLKESFS